MRHAYLLPFLALGILLTSCGQKEFLPIPKGVQEISGILRPAELSVVRRGTHLLIQDDAEVYYLESSEVGLRPYEGKLVTLKGRFFQNVDPEYLPVMVVEEILSSEETTKEFAVRNFGLLIEVPTEWMKRNEGSSVLFVPKGMEAPVLKMQSEVYEEFPEGGVPIVVGGRRALRMIDEFSARQIVVIKLSDTELLTMVFDPQDEHGDLEVLRGAFLSALNSIEFLEVQRPDVPETGTGETLGKPCGGVAGILCPDDFYCEVSDLEENIGRCRKI